MKLISKKRLKSIKSLIDIQCSDGNYNYDSYMHGMANGMIIINSIIHNIEPEFLDGPEKFLSKM